MANEQTQKWAVLGTQVLDGKEHTLVLCGGSANAKGFRFNVVFSIGGLNVRAFEGNLVNTENETELCKGKGLLVVTNVSAKRRQNTDRWAPVQRTAPWQVEINPKNIRVSGFDIDELRESIRVTISDSARVQWLQKPTLGGTIKNGFRALLIK